jgi:hypothetical protein
VRILFATTRGAGHLGPLVPFAQAAERAGHEVLRETMEFASAVAAVRYEVPQARIGIHLDSRIDSGSMLELLAGEALDSDPEALRDGPLLTRSPGDEPGVHRFRTDAPRRRDPDLVYVTFGSEAPASPPLPRRLPTCH